MPAELQLQVPEKWVRFPPLPKGDVVYWLGRGTFCQALVADPKQPGGMPMGLHLENVARLITDLSAGLNNTETRG